MWYWVQKFTNTKILFKFVGYWPMISIFCDIPGLEKKPNHVYSVIFNGKRIFGPMLKHHLSKYKICTKQLDDDSLVSTQLVIEAENCHMYTVCITVPIILTEMHSDIGTLVIFEQTFKL